MGLKSDEKIRSETERKRKALEELDAIGLDLPTAIRMFLKKSISEQGIPFSTKLESKKRGIELLNEFSSRAKLNKTSDMSLGDINNEISKYRAGK